MGILRAITKTSKRCECEKILYIKVSSMGEKDSRGWDKTIRRRDSVGGRHKRWGKIPNVYEPPWAREGP